MNRKRILSILREEAADVLINKNMAKIECDHITRLKSGAMIIYRRGKCSPVTKNGKLLSPGKSFDAVSSVGNGLFYVKLNGKYNILGDRMGFISPEVWFDDIARGDDNYMYGSVGNEWYALLTPKRRPCFQGFPDNEEDGM